MSSLRSNDKGVTLLIVAASLVILLGMCALSIDLVAGYLARVQCQRAADAAALAGAKAFANGCTTVGCTSSSPETTLAWQNAIAVAAQNPVMGLAPTSKTVSYSFDFSHDVLASGGSGEPQLTVTVHRDSASGDPMPTFFAKIFGIKYMNVSASATAEAFNPGGTGTNVGVGCVKPFLVPNCDPNFPVAQGDPTENINCPCGSGGLANGDCAGGPASVGKYMSYYVDPNTGDAVHPKDCQWDTTNNDCLPTSGDIGAPWVLHDNGNVPSQWLTIAFTSQSGMQYSQYIRECAPISVACQGTLNTLNGKKVGPTDSGVDCLIHSCGSAGCSGQCPATGAANNLPDGLNNGQDYMCAPYALPGATAQSSCPTSTPSSPFTIIAGANNPYGYNAGDQFDLTTGASDSYVNVVLYDGAPLNPGGGTVSVVTKGYMSIFIQDALHNSTYDTVNAVIVQVGGCGSGGSVSTTPDVNSSGGGSFIPIRLIHN